MTDFNQGNIGTGVQSPVTVQQPEVSSAPDVETQATTSLFQNMSKIADGMKSKEAGVDSSPLTSAYMADQSKIADAVSQGGLTTARAKVMSRAMFNKYIAANPSMQGELVETHKSFIATSGMGKIIEKGTQEEQMRTKLIGQAQGDGIEFDLSNTSQVDKQLQGYLAQKRALVELETDSKIDANTKGKLSLKQAQRKEKGVTALYSGAAGIFDANQALLTGVLDEFEKNPDAGPALIEKVKAAQISANRLTSQLGFFADESNRKLVGQPVNDLFANVMGVLDGSTDKKAHDLKVQKLVDKQEALLMTDPNMAKMIAIRQVVPEAQIANFPIAMKSATSFMARTGFFDPTNTTPEGKETTKIILDMSTKSVKGLNSGDLDASAKPEVLGDVDRTIESMFRNIDHTEDVTSIQTFMNHVGSDEMTKFIAENRGEMSVGTHNKLAEKLQTNYIDNVMPAIKKGITGALSQLKLQDELGNETVARVDLINFIKADFIDGRINFKVEVPTTQELEKARPGFGDEFDVSRNLGGEFASVPSNQPALNKQVREFNKKYSALISKSVNAMAALNGQRPDEVWDQMNFEQFGIKSNVGGDHNEQISFGGEFGDQENEGGPKVAPHSEREGGVEEQKFAQEGLTQALELAKGGDIAGALKLMQEKTKGLEALTKKQVVKDRKLPSDFSGSGSPTDTLAPKREADKATKVKADSITEALIQIESSGRADAVNPASNATGLGQFVSGTWLEMMNRYAPEETKGKSKKEILDMRLDGDMSRKMVNHYIEENTEKLKGNDHEVTPGNIYLSHFLGPHGADRALDVEDGTDSIAKHVGKKAYRSNKSLFDSLKTIDGLKAWADKKMKDKGAK